MQEPLAEDLLPARGVAPTPQPDSCAVQLTNVAELEGKAQS